MVAAAGLALVTGLAVLDRLDTALAAMHRAGGIQATWSAVANPAAAWSTGSVRQLISSWRRWDADRLAAGLGGKYAGPIWTVGAAAIVDLLLIALPAVILLYAAAAQTRRRLRQRPGALGDDRDRGLLQAVDIVATQVPWVFLTITALRDALVFVVVRYTHPGVLVWLVGALTLAAMVIISIATMTVIFAEATKAADEHWATLRRWLREIIALRAQLLPALLVPTLLVLLGGDLGIQVDDLAMRWVERPASAVLAGLAAVATSWLILITGRASWAVSLTPPKRTAHPSRAQLWLVLGIGAALVAAWVGLRVTGRAWGNILVWPGIALIVFAILSLPEAVRVITPAGVATGGPAGGPTSAGGAARPVPAAPPRLLWSIAALPLIGLAVIAARAAVPLAVSVQPAGALALALVAGGVLPVGASVLTRLGRPAALPAQTWTGRLRTGSGWVVAIAMVTTGALCAIRPVAVGQAVGAVAILFVFTAVLVLVLFTLVWASGWFAPGGALAMVRLSRFPVLTFVVLWAFTISAVDTTDHYHDVRLLPAAAGTPVPVNLPSAVGSWLAQLPAPTGSTGGTAGGGGARPRVPMLFVATAGGGIRSADWTDLVLDCLFDPAPAVKACAGQPQLDETRVFAESGISGGAVGLAVHRALTISGHPTDFATALGTDFVSPDLAAMLFRDVPAFWLPAKPSGADRAAVLERAFEQATGGALDEPYFASSWRGPGQLRFPVLLLNSATVDDGCQLSGSVMTAATTGAQIVGGAQDCLTLAPFGPYAADNGSVELPAGAPVPVPGPAEPALAGAKDLYDYLCEAGDDTHHDLRMSTAALLAARFPYISPTGGLTGCGPDHRRTFGTDGGLVDGSGLAPLTQIWAAIAGQIADYNANPAGAACVEPRLLMIDNGYLDSAPVANPSQPQELIAPAQGAARAFDNSGARAEQAAALAFEHAFGSIACPGDAQPGPQATPSRIARLVPSARPGPRAPLGWSLSAYARQDLVEQLASPANLCQLALVRSWFPDSGVLAPGADCVAKIAASGP
jgi:hypothetical protein